MGNGIQWTPAAGPIDGTPGYNDYLLVKEERQVGDETHVSVLLRDRFDPQHLGGYKLAAPDEVQESGIYQPENGDQLFQLGAGHVVRKEIYLDRCLDLKEDADASKLYTFPSPAAVRAVAYFSGSSNGTFWCRSETPGKSSVDIKTPWHLTTSDGIGGMLKAVEQVEAAQNNNALDAQGVAAAVGAAELVSMKADLQARLQAAKAKEESWHQVPWYEKLWDGILVGLGFAAAGLALTGAVSCGVRRWQGQPCIPPRGPKTPTPRGTPEPTPRVEPKAVPEGEPLTRRIHVSDRRPAGPRQLPIEKIFPAPRPVPRFITPPGTYDSWETVPQEPLVARWQWITAGAIAAVAATMLSGGTALVLAPAL